MQRVVLDRERAEALLARSVVVYRPAGGGQVKVARLPVHALAHNGALAMPDEVVVDRRGDMPVRPVDLFGRVLGERGEEAMRSAHAPLGRRVVEQVQMAT